MTKAPYCPASKFQHVLPGQHVYEDVLFFGFSPPDVLDEVKDFEVRHSDVFIVTYPKAGTTWMQEIAWLLMNDGNFDVAKTTPVYMRSPFLEFKDTTLNEIGLDIANTASSPRVIKTHLPLKLMPVQVQQKRPKIILLFRNPKDVCVSYYNFYRSSSSFGDFHGDWHEFLEMFRDGHGGSWTLDPDDLAVASKLFSPQLFSIDHGSWFDFTTSWWHQRLQPNVKLMFYEDLKQNPIEEIKMLANFLGKTDMDHAMLTTIAHHCSFDQMKNNQMTNHLDVYSIDSSVSPLLRKGLVGDWKNQFTVKQNESFDILYSSKLGHLNIPFKYTFDF